jgi:hypothetical protein
VTAKKLILQSSNGVANVETPYLIQLVGELDGDAPGTLGDGSVFTIEQIELPPAEGSNPVVRAIPAKQFAIPSGLLKNRSADTLEFKDQATIQNDLAALSKELRARIADDLRRLGTIEVNWDGGVFLGVGGGSLLAVGQVKLGLAAKTGPIDGIDLGVDALVELRAVLEIDVEITTPATTVTVKRRYGVACRIEVNAALTIAIDFDDLNLSLPHVKLPRLDLTTLTRIELPGGALAASVAGAFARFISPLDVTYAWQTAQHVLVIKLDGSELLFAVAANNTYDLMSAPAMNDLATLNADITRNGAAVASVKGISFARFKDGGAVKTKTTANVALTPAVNLGSGQKIIGPLHFAWTDLVVRANSDPIPVFGSNPEPEKGSVRAQIEVKRLIIFPSDDPSAVIAVNATIEVNPSGVRIVDLALVEPYPFVLIERGAEALLRAAQKIIQLLAKIRPKTSADTEGLKRLLEGLGRIAAAIARAAVFVGEAIAKPAVKLAELIVELLKKLADLIPEFDSAQPDRIALDVEVRIALEPFEIRQVMLTLRDARGNEGKKLSVLGVDFAIPKVGPPALLFDFVSEPGAYLVVAGPEPENFTDADGNVKHRVARVSTDLWLKRPDGAAAPMRDAAGNDGERNDDPLLQLNILQTDAAERLLIVLAGVSRGQAVFLRAARDTVKKRFTDVNVQGGSVTILDAPFVLLPLDQAFELAFSVNKDRVLPLLGMGEPGKSADTGGGTTPSFLDKLKSSLGQVVTVEKFTKPTLRNDHGKTVVDAGMQLKIKAAGVATIITLDFSLDESFELNLKSANNVFPLLSKRIQERALGLTWVVEQTDPEKLKADSEVEMFSLAFAGGESVFQLKHENAHMELHFDGLSSDGQGLVFDVSEMQVGRGGLDLVATVRDSAVRLNGLDVPFSFSGGRIEIRSGVFVGGAITARGQLPPALVGDATCTAAFVFGFESGEIVVKSAKVDLDKKGEPIICHATRFTITITNLDLTFVRDGGYHFYFLVTGSLRFTPKSGEFEDGLLKHLEDIEISLERAPLTGDARVLLRHISFQKALNPKKTFDLFNLFTFELRAFGFHPASPKFEGNPPAIDISGQIRFAETGDVIQPKIDFHELWIAPPKDGQALPRIKADGLGVELQLGGSVKIRGAVLAVDPNTRTVEGRQFAPDGYDTYGFLGEGAVDIPGFAALEASLGFLEVERKESPGDRKIAFFLYLQENKLAVEIPTPVWTFYLREVGFGFGYRYTLTGIKEAERTKSAAQLVKVLDDVSRSQGDLSRFTAWLPDPEKDNFTLALRGAFQMFPAEKKYDEDAEKKAVNPLFFDIIAALRSDFTFLLSTRAWAGVNYASFLANAGNFRERPTLRGFLYISVPRSELLLRGIGDAGGYIGSDWPEVMPGTQLRAALQSVNWTTTLYIRPGLFHFEMGWPDQLSVELVKEKNMRVTARGGMIFRAADEGILFGFNVEAEAFLHFEGRAGDSIGVALVAELSARLVARVLAFLAKNFNGSLVYGLVSLDARLTFSVQAWMDVDLGFTSFTIRIGFSFSVQFTAVVELSIVAGDGVGGRVNAQIAVQVFGCTLGVGIGFSFNNAKLDAARARVERFLSLSITSEEPDAPPVFAAKKADAAIDKSSTAANAVHNAPPPEAVTPNVTPGLKPSKKRPGGRPIRGTDFWLVMRKAVLKPGGADVARKNFAYALLLPKEATSILRAGFYADSEKNDKNHTVRASGDVPNVEQWIPGVNGDFKPFTNGEVRTHWEAKIAVPDAGENQSFTLRDFFDECFITDADWISETERKGSNWREPATLRAHRLDDDPLSGSREERNQRRHQHQLSRAAEAVASPFDERAFSARSTLMTMFLDQFVTLAQTGKRAASTEEVDVTDLGLVFYGPTDELEKLIEVVKHEKFASTGSIEILNRAGHWFENVDPVLAADAHAVETDGIKLHWQLKTTGNHADAEHFLHHYEVLRSIDVLSIAPQDEPFRVKPAATVGERHESEKHRIRLVRPDWQFVDKLDDKDISPTVRRALLPAYGETESIDAAKAWLAQFPGRDSVTVTYSVTPVDIAGTRALPRGFAVPVRRPQPAIRPAVGELRMVQRLGNPAAGAQREKDHPHDLDVYLAFKDDAWEGEAKFTEPFGGIDYSIERLYRIVVDPEELEPAGHYGSSAASSRVRGPGALGVTQTADERSFEVACSATVDIGVNADAKPFLVDRQKIADEDELKNLPRWAALTTSGTPLGATPALQNADGFLNFLWHGADENPVRVATRHSLETIIRITNNATKETFDLVSKRVPLPVSHIIDTSVKDAMIRPEAFEWVVPLDFPPLAEGQVRTESGFARFQIPASNQDLGDFLEKGAEALKVERDPARRILTTVRFAAVPDWVSEATLTKPLAFHGTSIAGYDLHELDLDDLPPLDAKSTIFSKNVAWKRSRRVARIEHLSSEEAQLVPSGNADWQGWEAHYPSETRRIAAAREKGKDGDAKPIRSAWYSDRETTPHFAERRPRLRFFSLPPESEIAELMRGGRPQRINASIIGMDAKDLPAIRRHKVDVSELHLAERFSESAPFVKVDAFTGSDLRDLLTSIDWNLPVAYVDKWKTDKQAFAGLQLIVDASHEEKGAIVPNGSTTIPLDFVTPDEDDAANPRPRLLLRIDDDSTITPLLQNGQPTRIVARLFAPDGSRARATDDAINTGAQDRDQIGKRIPLELHRNELALRGDAFGDVQEFERADKTKFRRIDVRDLLRSLEWSAFEDSDPYLAKWRTDHHALDGLQLLVEGSGTFTIDLQTQTAEEGSNQPRHRFATAIDDAAIAQILNNAETLSIKIRLTTADGTRANQTDVAVRDPLTSNDEKPRIGLRLPRPRMHRSAIEHRPEANSDRSLFLNASTEFTSGDLRHLLLCLGWSAFAKDSETLKKWLKNNAVLDALKVVIEASRNDSHGESVTTGRVEIPLSFHAVQHPLLEEALAELAFDLRDNKTTVYRRYNVLPQPVTPIAAKDLPAFMAATAPETDPYGWQILQLLGQAASVRLCDRGEERFVPPKTLARRVNAVLRSVLVRWREAYGEEVIGQPFAEVFLKPGANRLAGPFDAVLSGALETEKANIELDDDGLAFMQLSLRPRPSAVLNYFKQTITWQDVEKVHSHVVALTVKPNADVEVARARGGAIVAISKDVTQRIQVPIAELVDSSNAKTLTLFYRVAGSALTADTHVFIDDVEAAAPIVTIGPLQHVSEPAAEAFDPFARFESIPADQWVIKFGQKDSAAEAAILALRDVMRASGADTFHFPDPPEYGTVVSVYLTWVQRFLDSGAPRGTSASPYFALVAPAKAAPWRLAANSEGFITLTFLHSDRWAHARAYAVRPLSRYHELLSGLGVGFQRLAAEFHDDMPELDAAQDKREIGYSVAVSPRTERIEPPLILQSRIAGLKNSNAFVNEIIVARHGEESLAMSNRPLFARLGMPSSLIAFMRDYRLDEWPKRLHTALEKPEQAPEKAKTLQPRPATLPQCPAGADPAAVTAEVIGPLAHDVPSLWKGADILRVAPLPPHYRLTAFASERAGIVVSDVVTVIADEQPREPLASAGVDLLRDRATLSLVRAEDGIRFVFKHPFISHRNLTPSNAVGWITNDVDDVGFWPDPDVTYRISRRALDAAKKALSIEEDADVKLVNDAKEVPLAVRALGPILVDVPGTAVVRSSIATGARMFELQHSMQLRAAPPPRRIALTLVDCGAFAADVTSFNDAAEAFAVILTPHMATIDIVPNGGETGVAYIARARAAMQAFLAIAKPWFAGPLIDDLRAEVVRIDTFLATADAALPPADLRTNAGMPSSVATRWLRGFAVPGFTFAEIAANTLDPRKPGIVLSIDRFATDAQLVAVRAACSAPVTRASGPLQVPRRPDREGLKIDEFGDYDVDIPKLNTAAKLFAAILTPHRVRLDIDPIGAEPGVTYIPRARSILRKALDEIATKLETTPWYDGMLATRIEALDTFFATANDQLTGPALNDLAKLPIAFETPLLRGTSITGIDVVEKSKGALNPDATGVTLVVWDVAADDEVGIVKVQCPAPVAQPGGRLHRILKRRLFGESSNSIWLTATDVRTRIKGGPDRVPLADAEFGDFTNDIAKFNEAARTFAAILTPHHIDIDIAPLGGEAGADYIKRARIIVDAIRKQPSYGGDLMDRIDSLKAFFATASDPSANALHASAGLPDRVDAPWLRGVSVAGLTCVEKPSGTPGVVLIVFGLATPAEVANVAAKCPAPVAQAGGRLQQILAQPKTPGVAEVRIEPAVWLKEVLAAEGGEA